MAIYIYWRVSTWCVDPAWPSDIVDEWNYDPEVSKLLHEMIHIVSVGKSNVIEASTVLVFGLEQDDRTPWACSQCLHANKFRHIHTIGDLCFGDNRCDMLDVVLRSLLVICIWRSKVARNPLQKPWQPT